MFSGILFHSWRHSGILGIFTIRKMASHSAAFGIEPPDLRHASFPGHHRSAFRPAGRRDLPRHRRRLSRVAVRLRISNDLERVGDLAEDISERVLHLVSFPDTTTPDQVFTLADLVVQMVHESLDATRSACRGLLRPESRTPDPG